MVFAGPSYVPTVIPRESTVGPLPPATWHTDANVLSESNMGNKCSEVMPDGPGAALHLVVHFGCFSQIDLHPTGQTPQVPDPISLVRGDLLVEVVNAQGWLTLPTWPMCLGQARPLQGRALQQTTHRVKPTALHAPL